MSDYNRNRAEELVNLLKVLFGRVPASKILSNRFFYDSFQYKDAEFYMQKAEDLYKAYSGVECRNMVESIGDYLYNQNEPYMRHSECGRLHVFHALTEGARLLLKCENVVVCRYENILLWRSLVRSIGEDLPVVACYVQEDRMQGRAHREFFGWSYVIRHNNHQLNQLVRRGISEHHFHLFASMPYFQISWISLMNNFCSNRYCQNLCRIEAEVNIPTQRDYIGQLMDGSLQPKHELSEFVVMCKRAAIVRLYLGLKLAERTLPEQIEELWKVRRLLQNPDEMEIAADELQSYVEVLQAEVDGEDYAIGFLEEQKQENLYIPQGEVAHIIGERWFLYEALRDSCEESDCSRLSREERNLFYFYLRIQIELRNKIVQTNDKVGFDNFQEFDHRRLLFLPSSQLAARMAVRETLQTTPYLQELEARVSPSDTAEDDCRFIQWLDHSILKGDASAENVKEILEGEQELLEREQKLKDRFYYVFHFIKRPDVRAAQMREELVLRDFSLSVVEYRHCRLREKLEKQAKALVCFRERYPQAASRVCGIDAASQEIGCRPEVFGPIFRRLGQHSARMEDPLRSIFLPRLGKTYHAGEDFLDVVDGLRAIDEAIRFLDLDCGDRLGHALAFGIDVHAWYQMKGRRLSLPMQDHLDNVAWMYHALKHYKIADCEVLKRYLEEQFRIYFQKCYLNHMSQNAMEGIMSRGVSFYAADQGDKQGYRVHTCLFDMDIYYKAWSLRGDHPALYRDGFYHSALEKDPWDCSMVNLAFPQEFGVRYIPECSLLNFYYHYNAEVRRIGSTPITVDVPMEYVEGCEKIQKRMQVEFVRRGIAIETNPSSNVLIGTFRAYEKHPLVSFYNQGLVSAEQEKTCPQINVSINTDDNGVFFTSLENEYALMASALENILSEGQPLYSKTSVYQWLEHIRRMSNEQSFQRRELPVQ